MPPSFLSFFPSVLLSFEKAHRTQQEGRCGALLFYWLTQLMRAHPALWQEGRRSASMRRWRPPGCEEGTARPSFIDILCVALPSAALSRSVCVPLWGSGDRVMDDTRLYARRDSTAGPLNDRGAWPSTHLPRPGLGRRPHGEREEPLPRSMGRCSRGETAETAALRGPLRFSPLSSNWKSCKRSIVWYWLSLSASCSFQPEHDKKQHWLLDSFGLNYCLSSCGCPRNDAICKHSQWINLHMQRGTGHLMEAMDRAPREKPNHWVHYTDSVMTFGLQMKRGWK